jgi:hypothetical protein
MKSVVTTVTEAGTPEMTVMSLMAMAVAQLESLKIDGIVQMVMKIMAISVWKYAVMASMMEP